MRDPGLPPHYFQQDVTSFRERLFSAPELVRVKGAVREGDSVELVSPARLSVTLPDSPNDLSRFNQLCVEILNCSAGPLLVGSKLTHLSPCEKEDQSPVSVSGGREYLPPREWMTLKFPRESFGSYGSPKGWQNVRELALVIAREKADPSTDHIRVKIRSIDGEFRETVDGPRLSEQGLGKVLQRDVPGVTKFFGGTPSGGQVGPGDLGSAWTFCGAYAPDNPALLIPPPHPYPIENPEEILRGRIMGQRLPDPIPWDADPHGILEWTHFLNRHHFMGAPVRAFAQTNDEAYAEFLDRAIRSWITSNPVPLDSNGGAGPAWETLSAAWRLREWLRVIGIAWPCGSFNVGTKRLMLCSVWEHARSLMDHRGHPNNWIIVESAALALAGICFPQFREAPTWKEEGLERLRIEFRSQFFSDGVHFEISPLYHAICLHAFIEVKQAAAATGVELPHEFDAPLERCCDYLAALCRPDFTWPSLNDSGGATNDYTALMRVAGEVFKRPDLLWIGSAGREGKRPEEDTAIFPDAGITVMRSGHEPDSNFLLFRAGPPGAAHQHGDALSLDVAALGIPRLVDPGITTYAPDPLTDYYRSPDAHNMILIDGKGPDRSAMSFREKTQSAGENLSWTREGLLEIATGVCTGPWEQPARAPGMGPDAHSESSRASCHYRTVVFVNREYWIIRDLIAGKGEHELTACWQFLPGRVEIDIETYVVLFKDARGPGFQLTPLLGPCSPEIEIYTGSRKPPRGWVSINGTDLPGAGFRFTVSGKLPAAMVWALIPVSGGPVSGVEAHRLEAEDGAIALDLRFREDHRDLITMWPPNPTGASESERCHGRIDFKSNPSLTRVDFKDIQ